jgi:histidinol phosphatase-like enzyme
MFKYKRVAIDFDGTLFEECKNVDLAFKNNEELLPMKGAAETTNFLFEKGFEILIFTCRPDYHRKYMENLLNKNNIKFDYILFYTKPRVDLYIDNKGYRFENWEDTKQFIKSNMNLEK